MYVVSVVSCLIWIITLVGLVLVCIYGVEESKPLIAELDIVFRDLINRCRQLGLLLALVSNISTSYRQTITSGGTLTPEPAGS